VKAKTKAAGLILAAIIATIAIGLLCIVSGLARAAVTNVYWRVDLNQGSSIIAYGQGATEADAWADCFRLQAITRAMSSAETRKLAVSAVTGPTVRWCKNPMRYAMVSPDPVGQATLSWSHVTPPAIAGFRIVHGADQSALTNTIQIANPALRTYTINSLTPGGRCFAVKAYDASDVESVLSNVVCKVIL
jgi:hypothetical protein